MSNDIIESQESLCFIAMYIEYKIPGRKVLHIHMPSNYHQMSLPCCLGLGGLALHKQYAL